MPNQCMKCNKYEKPNDNLFDNNPYNIPVIKQIKGNFENSQCIYNNAYISSYICDECYNILISEGKIQELNGYYYINTNRPQLPS